MAVAVHIYISLSFLEFPHALQLAKIASAHIPSDDEVIRAQVESPQLDNSYETPWEVHPEAAEWDPVAESTRLRHTQVDHDRGVRGFFQDILEATKCHEDLQETHDDGALQAYLVKYPVKFSDSAKEEWLNDAHGGDTLAQSILFR